MYLLILDTCDCVKTAKLTESDFEVTDEQDIYNIIDISDPDNPLIYTSGQWLEVEPANRP